MDAATLTLIHRLRERSHDPQRAVTLRTTPPQVVLPPIAAQDVQQAEQTLGLVFPPLFHALYTHVGNGGFGPGTGLFSLHGPVEHGVVETALDFREFARKNPRFVWPQNVVALASLGDVAYVGLLCTPDNPYLLYCDAFLGARLNPSDHITLHAWLEGWLADQPEPFMPAFE